MKNRKKKIIKPPFWTRIPIVGVYKDLSNYRSWIKTIKEEVNTPNSKFNKLGMQHNFFYIVYLTVSLPEEESEIPESSKRLRVMENLTPVHQYLDDELGFAGYLVPEFSQFYDKEGNPTLTYAAIYRFAFNTLGVKWVISRTIFWSLFFVIVNYFSLFEKFLNLFK